MFKKSIQQLIPLLCFIKGGSLLETTMLVIANSGTRGIIGPTIRTPMHELSRLSIGEMREYLNRDELNYSKNIACLQKLLRVSQGYERAKLKLLIETWNSVRSFFDTGKDLMLILDGMNCLTEDAYQEFAIAIQPNPQFAAMLAELQLEKFRKWKLTNLPQNIGENQKQQLLECRRFIEENHPDLLPKMYAICEVCGVQND
jgi:hypothetical protein